jgi:ethanolamine ammonia-lyase small subunit
MKKEDIKPIDPLLALQEFTAARIAIGRVGTSIPLKQALLFKLAHAYARDAVYSELDMDALIIALKQFELPILQLHSKVHNRQQYLLRPDLGRKLNALSKVKLSNYTEPTDIAIIIADGLSAAAINDNVVELLSALLPLLQSAGLALADIVLVEQGRVAIADEIAFALNAKIALMLIGERPGLSSADSIGAYLTYMPKPGLTDEARNCVSNIRPHGLNYKQASKKIFYLVQEALKRKISGVQLKDNAGLLSE